MKSRRAYPRFGNDPKGQALSEMTREQRLRALILICREIHRRKWKPKLRPRKR